MRASWILILVIASTLKVAKAATDSREEFYEVVNPAYVISESTRVIASCEQGDQVISGSCSGENRNQGLDEREYGVYLKPGSAIGSGSDSASGSVEANGWQCQPSVVHPRQLLKIVSAVVCRRGQPNGES